MRRRGLSPHQIDEVVRPYGAGWSLARIGERLQVDPTTVHNNCGTTGYECGMHKDSIDSDHESLPNGGLGRHGRTRIRWTLRDAHYNTGWLVSRLNALLEKLPAPTAKHRPAGLGQRPGTAKQLDEQQVQKLIAGYLASATVYQLRERLGLSGGP
jgi:hypothetical protein